MSDVYYGLVRAYGYWCDYLALNNSSQPSISEFVELGFRYIERGAETGSFQRIDDGGFVTTITPEGTIYFQPPNGYMYSWRTESVVIHV